MAHFLSSQLTTSLQQNHSAHLQQNEATALDCVQSSIAQITLQPLTWKRFPLLETLLHIQSVQIAMRLALQL